jgi:hypothetical protein
MNIKKNIFILGSIFCLLQLSSISIGDAFSLGIKPDINPLQIFLPFLITTPLVAYIKHFGNKKRKEKLLADYSNHNAFQEMVLSDFPDNNKHSMYDRETEKDVFVKNLFDFTIDTKSLDSSIFCTRFSKNITEEKQVKQDDNVYRWTIPVNKQSKAFFEKNTYLNGIKKMLFY